METTIFFTKKEIDTCARRHRIGQYRFYWSPDLPTHSRVHARVIKVFGLSTRGCPICIGETYVTWEEFHARKYKGDFFQAAKILNKIYGYKHNSSKIHRKDVVLYKLD